jgi:integrase/recombinase XerC
VLRHTFATHLLSNGAELSAIKELMGHAGLAATQVYTHTSVEKLKEAYKRAHPKAGS